MERVDSTGPDGRWQMAPRSMAQGACKKHDTGHMAGKHDKQHQDGSSPPPLLMCQTSKPAAPLEVPQSLKSTKQVSKKIGGTLSEHFVSALYKLFRDCFDDLKSVEALFDPLFADGCLWLFRLFGISFNTLCTIPFPPRGRAAVGCRRPRWKLLQMQQSMKKQPNECCYIL